MSSSWIRECRGPKHSLSWTTSGHRELSHTIRPARRSVRGRPVRCSSGHSIGSFQRDASVQGMGLHVNGLYLSVCFSLPGSSQCHQRNSLHRPCMDELLGQAGLRFAWRDAVWCSSAPDSLEATISVSDVDITRKSREKGDKALGVWITIDGRSTEEMAERDVNAWRCFYSLRHLLCDNNVVLKHRLRVLILLRVIHVLVRWQLDTHTVAMH